MSTTEFAQQALLSAYLDILHKWNKTYNLTSVRARDEMQVKHINDSLAVTPHLHGQRIIDVGTGAGLPGIPLAIMNPDKHFTLLDSSSKKTRFLKQAKQALELENIEIVQSRVEEFQPAQGFDSVISRAFASIDDMLHGAQHLVCANGRFLAMKGVPPTKELQQLPAGFELDTVHTLEVAGLDAERCLVVIKKSA
jgi:16S rRNA (guanine527-N7)-methyltransferase